ncbi:uncharacterized protein METZ01_LOCUS278048 [marine metagenome]|uniref:Methyltransferase domain-containing protein n=1 Tax=marine metagenome TaxID=408172 RepID=A0A382KJU5_9ZZZZ
MKDGRRALQCRRYTRRNPEGAERDGKDINNLSLANLAPVDEFHMSGREATLELVDRAELKAGLRVLDVGCGIDDSVRHLAVEHECHVSGLNLTPEYVDTAKEKFGNVIRNLQDKRITVLQAVLEKSQEFFSPLSLHHDPPIGRHIIRVTGGYGPRTKGTVRHPFQPNLDQYNPAPPELVRSR